MAIDYFVLCLDRPEDSNSGWRREAADLVEMSILVGGDKMSDLESRYGVDAALAISLNCHHSEAEFVDELAELLARAFRGVVWCDHAGDAPIVDFRSQASRQAELPSLEFVVDQWIEWVTPLIEERRRRRKVKRARQQKLYEQAQSGEDVGGDFDWGMDDL